MKELIGSELTDKLESLSMNIYNTASEYALNKGIIIADTKFEFGLLNGEVILIDEVLTPDSSRFWPSESYKVGSSPVSFDKQIIRDYIDSTDWDKESPIPGLPNEIIEKAAKEYSTIESRLINA